MALLLLTSTMLLLAILSCNLAHTHSRRHFELRLLHRHSIQGLQFSSTTDAFKDLVVHDAARLSSFRRRKRQFWPPSPATTVMPVASAAKLGSAFYFVEAFIGTPKQRVLLAADTGSDLIWVNCSPNPDLKEHHMDETAFPSFHPENSSTASYVRCFSKECAALSPDLDCVFRPKKACRFSYGYKSGASASGPFLRDTFENRTLLFFGCGTRFSGFSSPLFGGVLGLGRGFNSFPAQTRDLFGAVFSYCLGNYLRPSNAKSSLVFGSQTTELKNKLNLSYTPILSAPNSNFYYLGVEQISVGGETLTLPLEKLRLDTQGKGGVILDSGTSLTFLEEASYRAVMDGLRAAISYPTATTEDPANFELCFNVSGASGEPKFPEIVISFSGGVDLRAGAENYALHIEDGVRCIGIMAVAWPSPSIIGALIHQNYFVEFDLNNSLLGLAKNRC